MKIKTVGDLKEIMRGLPDTSPIVITSGENECPFIEGKIISDGTKRLTLNTDLRGYTDEDLEDLYKLYKMDREAKRKKCLPAGVLQET